MSNARNRARQLERAALAPRRITNRAVVPDGALMLAQHADGNCCRNCGFAVCSCVTHVPMRAYEWTIASLTNLETFTCRAADGCAPKPAPGAFVVPKGWYRHEVSDSTWLSLRDGEPFTRPCVATQKDGKWGGWATTLKYGSFTSPYAAMLCALGCEVDEYKGSQGAYVDRKWHGWDGMPALVERLTAERANEQAVIAECREIRREEDATADAARARAAAIVTRDRAGLEQHARIDAEREP